MFIKKFIKYNPFSDLTPEQSFNLELECYHRLSGYPNFPRLIDVNKLDLTITLEDCGLSLKDIKYNNETIGICDLSDIKKIINTLKKENIVHLDFKGKNPKNACYKSPNIFLIDFDVAVIDSMPLNQRLTDLYTQWTKRGGYSKLEKDLEFAVTGLIK